MKKIALFFTILCAGALNGENIATISPSQMQDKDQAHRKLLGKITKLEGYDIYVGAGYSDAGEQMFFAMEKLDDKNTPIWANYAKIALRPIVPQLLYLSVHCDDQATREKFKDDLYRIKLMDTMCPNKKKFSLIFGEGTKGGITGFSEILGGDSVYVAYASPQPIIGPFVPKKEIGVNSTLEEFEVAYSDIIISIGVAMLPGTSRTEHRGVFKNPFYEVYGTYKNIWLKLHGWAGTVEEQAFHKTYMTVFPIPAAADLLHRAIKPGEMYIGIDTQPYPYDDEELRKKFPPIKQELIGIQSAVRSMGFEPLHVFELKVLSKYYTATKK